MAQFRPFVPTDEQRRQVEMMAGFGVPQVDISRLIGCDKKTLEKYFRDDLDRGMAKANARVTQTLFKMATDGKNTAATIFWLKARAQWREKSPEESGQVINVQGGLPK